ncbi:MAG TPA: hypothetical protein VN714_28015 [Trebonia sp.]|jgi:hypothetical protein|nr:hypothetical protein [Trebonia sp.]
MPDTAGGLAFIDTLSIGGQRVTGMRLSGAAIAGIVTSIPLPPVTRRAPPTAAPRCTPP